MIDWLFLSLGSSEPTTYLLIFLALLGGALFLPIPEDAPLIFAGILAQRGHGDLLYYLVVCYVGILFGDVFLYFIGRRFGTALSNRAW